jgi:hypothetical protein
LPTANHNALKVIWQLLGIDRKVWESRWEISKGFVEQLQAILKCIAKLLGNALLTLGNEANSKLETRQNCPADIGKNVAISIPFF